MRTIIVDDEVWALTQLQRELDSFKQIEVVGCFEDPREALEYAQSNPVDFALLDIEMPFMDGLELGIKLKKLHEGLVLIYLTGYDAYVKDAILDVKADYYLLKPYDHKDIESVVNRVIALGAERLRKEVRITVFDGFELYIHGEMIHFVNKKAKELLALCVHMEGKHVSLEKAVDVLWEDHPYDNSVKSLYRKAVIYLNTIFREHGIDNVFENGRGYCCIHRENVECDYFDYFDGKPVRENLDLQERYLQEYPWADYLLAAWDREIR
ncbi:MAG: response regulator [Lachnospiraceae bacterium]|nr:response regulator [Lachnospiraceae bacterium]